jgi:hypothetical protein
MHPDIGIIFNGRRMLFAEDLRGRHFFLLKLCRPFLFLAGSGHANNS